MTDPQTLLTLLFSGNKITDFDSLDPELEKEEIETINKKLSTIKEIISQDRKILYAVIDVLNELEYLKKFKELMEQPVYLNKFNDKYGNTFLQARTSIRDSSGKTKWINGYLGSINKFEKGVNDPSALELGKILIRKKLKKYYLG
jgi:predicted regulator of amino acid metabolism with ACT domain